VWQHQHVGASYSVEALAVPATQGSDACDWQKQLLSGEGPWALFNREAQAQSIQVVYTKGELLSGPTVMRPGGGGFCDADGTATTGRLVVDTTDHAVPANDATSELRGRRSARLSSRFS